MKAKFNNGSMNMDVTDLKLAEQTKSKEEVSKMFIEKASFIISAKLKGKASAKKVVRGKPLWDIKQLKANDWFSQNSYVNVRSIDSDGITTVNQRGDAWKVSKDIMTGMYSADHFDKTVKMTMTDLAGLMEEAKDTVIKVQFKKKLDEKTATA